MKSSKLTQILCLLPILLSVSAAYAASKDTNNVKVKLISVWTSNGNILVQTNPRANILGLTCTNDYWLVLYKNDLGYQAALSMLLSAQVTQKGVSVSAEDNSGNEFCRLRRVVNFAN